MDLQPDAISSKERCSEMSSSSICLCASEDEWGVHKAMYDRRPPLSYSSRSSSDWSVEGAPALSLTSTATTSSAPCEARAVPPRGVANPPRREQPSNTAASRPHVVDVAARGEGDVPDDGGIDGPFHVLGIDERNVFKNDRPAADEGQSVERAAVHEERGRRGVAGVGCRGVEGRQGVRPGVGFMAAPLSQYMGLATPQPGLQEYEMASLSSRQEYGRPDVPEIRVVPAQNPPPRGGWRRALFQTPRSRALPAIPSSSSAETGPLRPIPASRGCTPRPRGGVPRRTPRRVHRTERWACCCWTKEVSEEEYI